MANKMLIDASHPEETRVVVTRGNRIEEFDFESQDKKQLKGNIYLARVTRVEPSLQAAFVEYGGNRHGFLAFSEIHPDYYQIPVADRQALLRAEAQEAEDEDAEDEDGEDRGRGRRNKRRGRNRGRSEDENKPAEALDASESDSEGNAEATPSETDDTFQEVTAESDEPSSTSDSEQSRDDKQSGDDEPSGDNGETSGPKSIAAAVELDEISEAPRGDKQESDEVNHGTVEEISSSNDDEHEIESVGAEDAIEEARDRRRPVRRHYKIQEVIKRRQILLVQVVKEERGNKGAALTTYLSLAGRYSVLMPNTARGGGISRKITNAQDRKRLKEVVAELEVPKGMGVILRTAGESRTKAEIKRDYEYLMRLWENVRTLTLQSSAPALVYEEGSLIKRSVRDLYNKDIDEILVSGEEGYREAKDFMRMLMPSHAKVVQPYRDTTPILVRSGIEAQLDRMLQPQVTLKSGGYIIINQTEALVAIDVNSGRSTKEHSIEETALHTNLEAAEEVARQLRLRDLAGLIVIDFIDMEENRNNRAVEKKMKDCLKNDRARIQVGRISHFGLLEMSRQRIRASVLESTMKPCPHCGGTGHVRSDSSVALLVVRAIEESLLKDSRHHITVKTPVATALYILNHKRSSLVDLEKRFAVTITLEPDETVGAAHHAILRGAVAEKPLTTEVPTLVTYEEPEIEDEEIVEVEVEEEPEEQPVKAHPQPTAAQQTNGDANRKRKRRRRRRGGRDRDDAATTEADQALTTGGASTDDEDSDAESHVDDQEIKTGDEADASDSEGVKKRRRGKRGGKRNRRDDEALPENGEDVSAVELDSAADAEPSVETAAEVQVETTDVEAVSAEPVGEEKPAEPVKKPRRSTRSKKAVAETVPGEATAAEAEVVPAEDAKPAKRRATRRKTTKEEEPVVEEVAVQAEAEDTTVQAEATEAAPGPEQPAEAEQPQVVEEQSEEIGEEKPKKGGWWQRRGFF
ncbi:Rne/Rng family ribonuclease [Corticibacterium sp. UT-5YL-CI-8]|nr:Rne/Rng family ribonuclease [Tianweitania sp. UT-5YL-CI-8]